MAIVKAFLASILAGGFFVASPALVLASSATSGVDTQIGSDAALSLPLVITRGNISADIKAAPISAADVKTQDDLADFVSGLLHKHPDLSTVDAAADHVAVTCKEPGLFLGMIPVSADMTVTTDASGNITISQPWWDFLPPAAASQQSDAIQVAVNSVLGKNASGDSQLSLSQQAQLISSMESAMGTAAQTVGN